MCGTSRGELWSRLVCSILLLLASRHFVFSRQYFFSHVAQPPPTAYHADRNEYVLIIVRSIVTAAGLTHTHTHQTVSLKTVQNAIPS